MNRLRELLVALFKVPQEPQPTPGTASSLRIFRASPRFFQYSVATWSVKQVGALVGLVVSFATFGWIELGPLEDIALVQSLERLFLVGAGILYVVQIPVSLVMLRFGYEMRWYMVSDRSLRIREGIYRVREQTMTVANIQNMSIRQGPLQRLFGVADLEVQTAGGGAGIEEGKDSSQLHRGRLRGLDDAPEVRDVIRQALGRHRDAGLGDPDELGEELEGVGGVATGEGHGPGSLAGTFASGSPTGISASGSLTGTTASGSPTGTTASGSPTGTSPLLAAARQVLDEARSLRRDLGAG